MKKSFSYESGLNTICDANSPYIKDRALNTDKFQEFMDCVNNEIQRMEISQIEERNSNGIFDSDTISPYEASLFLANLKKRNQLENVNIYSDVSDGWFSQNNTSDPQMNFNYPVVNRTEDSYSSFF